MFIRLNSLNASINGMIEKVDFLFIVASWIFGLTVELVSWFKIGQMNNGLKDWIDIDFYKSWMVACETVV